MTRVWHLHRDVNAESLFGDVGVTGSGSSVTSRRWETGIAQTQKVTDVMARVSLLGKSNSACACFDFENTK